MNYNPYCPHCAVELDFDDHYDVYDDGDAIIVKGVPSVVAAGISTQRVSAMLTQLVNDGSVIKTEDKRKHFYSLA